mmetsp:Transcript_27162/g.68520  ORF Transcript_27162/g.68520 Transcript_27162/m.68520 type:complete len:240 (+) Transcript_27162:3537-4256(+)
MCANCSRQLRRSCGAIPPFSFHRFRRQSLAPPLPPRIAIASRSSSDRLLPGGVFLHLHRRPHQDQQHPPPPRKLRHGGRFPAALPGRAAVPKSRSLSSACARSSPRFLKVARGLSSRPATHCRRSARSWLPRPRRSPSAAGRTSPGAFSPENCPGSPRFRIASETPRLCRWLSGGDLEPARRRASKQRRQGGRGNARTRERIGFLRENRREEHSETHRSRRIRAAHGRGSSLPVRVSHR